MAHTSTHTTKSTSSMSSSTSTSNVHSGQSNSTSVSHAGISSGAAAGIGIGCVIAGLAIGILLTFFFAVKRTKTGRPKPREISTSSLPRSGNEYELSKGPSSTTSTAPRMASRPGVIDSNRLDQFLLVSKPDTMICNELQALSHLIFQHVENHYHCLPVQGSHSALSSTILTLGLEKEGSINSGKLVEITLDPRTRLMALNHVITSVVLRSVTLSPDSPVSLLPTSVSTFLQEIPPVEKYRGSQQAFSLALTQWRQLSAFLLHPNRSERSPLVPQNTMVAPRARELVHMLEPFLDTFVDPTLRNNQQKHLEDVILECAKFGYLLFSQPGELRMSFESGQERSGARELVVCPGLDRISNDQGNRYRTPERIISLQTKSFQ